MQTRILILASALLVTTIISACSTPEKVRRTFALSELSGQARAAADNGDDQRAYELWTEYVQRRPHAHYAQYELGLVETRLGLMDQAITHLTIAHDLRPGNVDYIKALADAYLKAADTESMMSHLRESVEEGGEVAGYLRLADYATRAGLMDDAKLALRHAVALGGNESPEPHLAMADFANAVGDTKLEREALSRALWFNPASRELDARFLALGITPGPSLAKNPNVEYAF